MQVYGLVFPLQAENRGQCPQNRKLTLSFTPGKFIPETQVHFGKFKILAQDTTDSATVSMWKGPKGYKTWVNARYVQESMRVLK